jgi:nucleotide-binding universal stress UspA family protein
MTGVWLLRGTLPTLVATRSSCHDTPYLRNGVATNELFANVKRQAQERNVELETNVLVGHPADQILKRAAKQRADLIAAGHRGRSALREWASGSKAVVLAVRAR